MRKKGTNKGTLYAVTDIETTGGHASGNAITEIAVYLTDGVEVLDTWHSLINPGTPIPRYIETLTGITDAMVRDAPEFGDITDELLAILDQGIFVAHNVNFDYSFIRESLKREGIEWKPRRMCTMRLARKAFPGMRSYGLGNLCRELEILNTSAHRAFGDAEATVRLLHMCLDRLPDEEIRKFIPVQSPENWLPAHLVEQEFLNLPEGHGVYFLQDRKGKPLYIGKANNIRKRVRQHFTLDLDSPRQQAFMKDVYHVDHIHTGSELLALLIEDTEIRKHWPAENRAQKQRPKRHVVMHYQDQTGYIRFAVQKGAAAGGVLRAFYSAAAAERWMVELAEKFDLHRKLAGLPYASGTEDLPPVDEHNERMIRAVAYVQDEGDFVLLAGGRSAGERAFVHVRQNSRLLYGFIPEDVAISDAQQLEPWSEPLMASETALAIVNSWARNPRKGVKVLWFKAKGEELIA